MKCESIRPDWAGAGLSVAKGGACPIGAPVTNYCQSRLQQPEKKACQNSGVEETGTHVSNYV